MPRVSYIFPVSHHYRLPFHEALRDRLARHNVDYKVVYSPPQQENRLKNDWVDIPWAVKVPSIDVFGIVYQRAVSEALKSDLVVVQQENKLALNYIVTALSALGIIRIAYFGHGRNFQARNPRSRAERWKRFWATKVNWWFGYTAETRKHVESLGFPADRITVFNNSVDTDEVRRLAAAVTPERQAERRRELGLSGDHVAIYVGGIYPDKRMAFLIEAAQRVRQTVPDFELIIAGGGSDFQLLCDLAASYDWIKVVGPRFGADKIELMSLGSVLLMPGLVGLAILDAGAMGLPVVTTAFPWHSPEIAYLEDGINGLIVQDWENAEAYGDAVAALLTDPPRLAAMQTEARALADNYSIEAMADRFCDGVLSALGLSHSAPQVQPAAV